MKLALILALLLSGCATPKQEGKLVGTLSVYRTNQGFMVVSDQSGDKMLVAFNVARIYRQKTKDSK